MYTYLVWEQASVSLYQTFLDNLDKQHQAPMKSRVKNLFQPCQTTGNLLQQNWSMLKIRRKHLHKHGPNTLHIQDPWHGSWWKIKKITKGCKWHTKDRKKPLLKHFRLVLVTQWLCFILPTGLAEPSVHSFFSRFKRTTYIPHCIHTVTICYTS